MDNITIQGAKTHNLKNINLVLPRDQLIVITGLSGSGKSSLAFDTLYAEGQRRYVESLSSYARQFLSMMEKPDVEHIEGLSPAISIEQKTTSHNPRSTVGTVTEIYDYLRLLFARVGEPACPKHKLNLKAQTVSQMVDAILARPEGSRIMILAPKIRAQKGEHLEVFKQLHQQGYVRVRVDGDIFELGKVSKLARYKKHDIDVVIDRVKVKPTQAQRLADSFAIALQESGGIVKVVDLDQKGAEQIFSERFACPECDYSLTELEPRLFSFNNPVGACSKCDGLGTHEFFDFEGVIPNMERRYRETDSTTVRKSLSRYMTVQPCSVCSGSRLCEAACHVYIEKTSLPELSTRSIRENLEFFRMLKLTGHRGEIASKIQKEIVERLQFLSDVGLDYLSLSRSADTLSGGEAQRIRLASQIGAGLVGVMYILDEPSIGLHQRDNARLLDTLTRLRDLGNTVIVVEHDEEAIRLADFLVDMGPSAGQHGGHVVAAGTVDQVIQTPSSTTAQFLRGERRIDVPRQRRTSDPDRQLILRGASGNNLKRVDLNLPIALFTCITGVSGSGKSTLINDTLYPIVANAMHPLSEREAQPYDSIEGLEAFDKVIDVNQSPIGRTPRSNPATYTGLFTSIRELFAQTEEARIRGYQPGRFSFNVKGGRCEACQGDGLIKVEMHFLPDIYVTCDECVGQRYNRETLDVKYKGRSIHDVLMMTVEEGMDFFSAIPVLTKKLQTLLDVGLGYLHLGQSATTLSGGESQRIKLAKELSKRDTGKTLYFLDEPTTGLHFHDIEQLLRVLQRLNERGNTIVVIEHHLDVIKTADWIIDLGPEGGEGGGEIIAEGTPEAVAKVKRSYTGRFLKPLLKLSKVASTVLEPVAG